MGRIRAILDMDVEPLWRFNPPVLVIGCMRSGTTLLVDKLAQHPQLLKVGNELRDVWTEIGGAPCESTCSYRGPEDVDVEAVAQMSAYFARFVEESKRLRRHLMRAKPKLKGMPGRIRYRWDDLRPLHKSTHLVNKIGYVHAMFPRSPIVFIVRSIFSQSASMKHHILRQFRTRGTRYVKPQEPSGCWQIVRDIPAHPDASYPERFEVIPEMWLRLNRLAIESARDLPQGTFMSVEYERLVTQQEDVLRDVFRFIGLDATDDPSVGRIARERFKPYNASTPGDPLTKWRQNLSSEEVRIIEETIARESRDFELISNFVSDRT